MWTWPRALLTFSRRPWPISGMSKCSVSQDIQLPDPEPDWDFLLNPDNRSDIEKNIEQRKRVGDIGKVLELNKELQRNPDDGEIKRKRLEEALKIPNLTHPAVKGLGEDPRVVKDISWTPKEPLSKTRSFHELMKVVDGTRTENLSHFNGERSYFLKNQIAELEQALIFYTLDNLPDFSLVSVPDLLHPEIVKRCGMPTSGQRSQVFHLDSHYGPKVLSGTSELALGGLFVNKTVDKPKKLICVSRCFRAEVSKLAAEKGLYRVFNFTKVEMFAVTAGKILSSDLVLNEFIEHQIRLFSDLDLAFRVLDMPPYELGAPAYRKFDIEAAMPGRGFENEKSYFGEISSCSNCTDYQSRRLNIRDQYGDFCHTVNGTACAIPRMIIAICEQYQKGNGLIIVPDKLRKYMRNAEVIEPLPKDRRLKTIFCVSPKHFGGKTVSSI